MEKPTETNLACTISKENLASTQIPRYVLLEPKQKIRNKILDFPFQGNCDNASNLFHEYVGKLNLITCMLDGGFKR